MVFLWSWLKLKKLVESIFDDKPQVNKYEVTEGVRSYGIVGKQLYNHSNIMAAVKIAKILVTVQPVRRIYCTGMSFWCIACVGLVLD